jgi:hypothetical protein
MARKLNARTQGLRNFVEMILADVRTKNIEGAERKLVDLWNDIGGAYVCKQPKPMPTPCPVGKYDPKKHGDYHAWLVANNCD